jgi:hypothetical protein
VTSPSKKSDFHRGIAFSLQKCYIALATDMQHRKVCFLMPSYPPHLALLGIARPRFTLIDCSS